MSSVPRVTRSRSRKATALVASGVTLLAVTAVGFAPGTAMASSHREAPLTAANPLEDNTDVYAFSSPDDPTTVTLIANWIPFEEPNGGPNFYPFGTGAQGYTYNINIDNSGSGKPDITYRWTFSSQDNRANANNGKGTFLYNNGPVHSQGDATLLFKQTYNLDAISGGVTTNLLTAAPVAPSNVGPVSMPNYQAELFQPAVMNVPGGGQSYAGQADDPFFLDLRVFDLLYGPQGKPAKPTETGQDTLKGYNVNTVSLKLPKSALALKGDATKNPVIGVWSTTDRATQDLQTGAASGTPVQVSRLGQPLVNEVVVPANLKDAFNSLPPTADATAANGAIVDKVLRPEVPALVEGIYGAKAPTGDPATGQTTNRTDLAEIFLTGVTTKFDGKNFYKGTLGAGTDKAPIPADLNSQVLNGDFPQAGGAPDTTKFQPSEMLRLNMSFTKPTPLDPTKPIDSRLGVAGNDLQGFPNGRRLADDVVDIELGALGGAFLPGQDAQAKALATGDGVNSNAAVVGATGLNANGFLDVFPYIAPPNNISVNEQNAGTTTVIQQAPATTPPAAGGSTPPANQGAAAPANGPRTPVGGVDTGAGGSTPSSAALPLVTGTAAVLLLAAGGASILSNRRKRAAAGETSAE